MKRVLLVFGTRPEAIKMAPVTQELRRYPNRFEAQVCVTAQHRQMLDQVLDIFRIEPDYDLDVMVEDQSLAGTSAKILTGLERVLARFRPDILLVQGDTITTMAAALAAYFQRIPVGHVEAGLRTGDRYSPWPEEINRKVSSAVANWHYAPTERARKNLSGEGINPKTVVVTGNTVVDALLQTNARLHEDRRLLSRLDQEFAFLDKQKRLVLITGHRRESFGPGLENVCLALKEIASKFDDVEMLFPVHLNPKVQEQVNRILSGFENILLVEPVDYLAFVYLMSRCHLIVSDSGGIQEEAPSLDKPLLVTREITERPEGVEAGAVKIIGTSFDRIVRELCDLLTSEESYLRMARVANPYGDGAAAARIVRSLAECL